MAVSIDVRVSGGVANMAVRGDIDERAAEDLKRAFRGVSLTGLRRFELDFHEVTHIGSAGIGKLLLFYKDLAAVGAQMHIVNVSPLISSLLREMRLDSIITISAKSA